MIRWENRLVRRLVSSLLGHVVAFGLSVIFVAEAGAQEPVPLTYRFLWDTEQPEEWQMLGRGAGGLGISGMIWGAEGEVLLNDHFNSRILRLTQEGELIQVIGRHGEGPGEFETPRAIGYDTHTGAVWVFDGGLYRYSIFTLKGGDYVYEDGFIAPWRRDDGWNLILDKDRTLWRCGALTTTPGAMDSPDWSRISLVNEQGRTLKSFGPRWDVAPGSPWSQANVDVRNTGALLELPGQRLLFSWSYRPIIEIWTKEGKLLTQKQVEGPYWHDLPLPRVENQHVTWMAGRSSQVRYERESGLIFITGGTDVGESGRALVFVGLDAETMEEREVYYVEIPGLKRQAPQKYAGLPPRDETGGPRFGISAWLPYRVEGEIRFIGVDLGSLSLMLFQPESRVP